METLHNFSLMAKEVDGETYKMHRLVQSSVQALLEVQRSTAKWRLEVLSILERIFFSGEYQTWRTCEAV